MYSNSAASSQHLTWRDYDRHGLNDLTKFDDDNVGHHRAEVLKEIHNEGARFRDVPDQDGDGKAPLQLVNKGAYGLVGVKRPRLSEVWRNYQTGLVRSIDMTSSSTSSLSSSYTGMGRGKKKEERRIQMLGKMIPARNSRRGDFSYEDFEDDDDEAESDKTGEAIRRSINDSSASFGTDEDGAAAAPSWPFRPLASTSSSSGVSSSRKQDSTPEKMVAEEEDSSLQDIADLIFGGPKTKKQPVVTESGDGMFVLTKKKVDVEVVEETKSKGKKGKNRKK